MTYPTKKAMTALNHALHLPATGRKQDWDIELADPDQVAEFAAYLEGNALDEDERLALMALTLTSLEDLAQRQDVPPVLSDRIRRLLQANPVAYADLIERWSPQGDDLDSFAISPLLSFQHN